MHACNLALIRLPQQTLPEWPRGNRPGPHHPSGGADPSSACGTAPLLSWALGTRRERSMPPQPTRHVTCLVRCFPQSHSRLALAPICYCYLAWLLAHLHLAPAVREARPCSKQLLHRGTSNPVHDASPCDMQIRNAVAGLCEREARQFRCRGMELQAPHVELTYGLNLGTHQTRD
jgi:hypothetical protein